jgi:hypothetical protein
MNDEYYSIGDYNTIHKIDAHVHYNTHADDFIPFALRHGFRLISINTNIPGFPSIQDQLEIVQQHASLHKSLYYLCTFDAEKVVQGNIDSEFARMTRAIKNGAAGCKCWKDIGMVITDADNKFVFVNDVRFKPFFDWAEKYSISFLGHIGEPKNCWLPLNEMTVNNDRNYFAAHPEYHMYKHPQYPAYEKLIESYELLLANHSTLRYVGAHLGSLEWSLAELAKRLEVFPNMAVDVAERMSHIQCQVAENRDEVRNFFLRYQDRIIYGTDLIIDDTQSPKQWEDKAATLWMKDWTFFVSDQQMKSPFLDASFNGLKLPKNVIDKIYRLNAEKWYDLNVHR